MAVEIIGRRAAVAQLQHLAQRRNEILRIARRDRVRRLGQLRPCSQSVTRSTRDGLSRWCRIWTLAYVVDIDSVTTSLA